MCILRPSPTKTEEAIRSLKNTCHINTCTDVILEIADLHRTKNIYSFDDDGKKFVKILDEKFIEEINQALQEGRTPRKSKKVDVTLRMAASVHILNHVISKLLDGQKPDMPDLEVTRQTLAKTISYVEWAESQEI